MAFTQLAKGVGIFLACVISLFGIGSARQILITAHDGETAFAAAQNAGLNKFIHAAESAGFKKAADTMNVTLAELFDSPELGNILKAHILTYPMDADLLVEQHYVRSLGGVPLDISTEDNTITVATPVSSADITMADILGGESYIQVIDGVLLPEL